ncbi:MAG: hypothetical protein GX886_10580, partial [Comamonadaceae bacterium]|nr:hypothetical protein [Comamonadaceae bacterium]
ATQQFGVDPALAEVTVKALADGELTGDEAKQIAVAACAWAGAVLGQSFGIPAPIGAFVGSAVGGIVVDAVFSAFGIGGDDAAERRRKLEEARQRWIEAQTKWNTEMLRSAWNAYLHYFEAVEDALQKAFDQYKDALAKMGGLRYFESAEIVVPFAVVKRPCASVSGCLYFATGAESVSIRQNPWQHELPIKVAKVTCQPGAKINGVPNAYAALRFWLASPRVSPTGQTGIPDWEQISKIAVELRGSEGKATEAAISLAQGLGKDIERASAAMALVMRDVIRTMAWVTVEEALKKKDAQDFANKLLQANKASATKSALVNSVLLAVGAGALAGWATAKLR